MENLKKMLIKSGISLVIILVAWYFLHGWAKDLPGQPAIGGEKDHPLVSIINVVSVGVAIGSVLVRFMVKFSFNETERLKNKAEALELLRRIEDNKGYCMRSVEDDYDGIIYEYDALCAEENKILSECKMQIDAVSSELKKITSSNG